ncbi:hypothetical protein BU26DRAFT_531763 [Trematosphaeria pertusa]|uniref:Amino acid permease/ SLC12A domain-containing protein n=1 Tax=Trematosphaeria pertusa TaxID=390896 RepID=A0A6A6IEK7_9PLEO|nr:uncharacterized protein BU26DRAFT_531763 [Trematosphaeria pertusa]KAF2248498.1 hypothetical protein BU26DRAFT_531763 [Trematosphaeria pertusa]
MAAENHFEHLDPALDRPELAGIGISGNVGVGLFVMSGALITTAGSIGGPLSYVVAGGTAACVLYTLTEMVACRPCTGSLIDLPHHFLDPACGFAVAASYSLANVFSMATLTAYSAELTALLKDKPERHSTKVEVGINVALVALTAFSHCLGVQVIMVYKLSLFVLVCILMVIINVGGGGPRQGSFHGNYTSYALTPGFKPAGFQIMPEAYLQSSSVPDTQFGIPGPGGRLFAFLSVIPHTNTFQGTGLTASSRTASTFAMFSCMGGEMVAMTAGEARNPWKDVPVVMSFVYLVPLTLYPFILMSGAANVNYADPNLPKIWAAGSGTMSLSPFVAALQSSSLHAISKALDLFFIISAYTAANTGLYVSSRSVFVLSQKYMPRKIANVFGKTNNGHTPLAAIALCSVFGFISLAGLSKYAYSQPRQTLSLFFTGSVACVYICECATFLRFKAGLERLEKRGILSRNDPLYISRMFKSRWQPIPAYIGIVGCSFVAVWSGIPPLYILWAKGGLTSTSNLKSNVALACDVLGAYSGPLLFATFYLSYKYISPRSFRVELCDLTPSDYIPENLASASGYVTTAPSPPGAPDPAALPRAVELEVKHCSFASPDVEAGQERHAGVEVMELTPDQLDEIEEKEAIAEQRIRIVNVLKKRPKRMERPLWRELWSCLVKDNVPSQEAEERT